MSNWIDINLPWDITEKELSKNIGKHPAYPEKAVNKAVLKKFNTTRDGAIDKFCKKYNLSRLSGFLTTTPKEKGFADCGFFEGSFTTHRPSN